MRRGLVIGSVTGVALALACAGQGTAQVLALTSQPLPGSSFQGGDGNQVLDPGPADWQSQQAAGRVRHAPDPNAEDDAFKSGSKEDEPRDWAFTVEPGGVSPAKVNIRDAWGSVGTSGGKTFVYGAFAREESGGSAFLTFELNRDGRLWDNGNANVPCRQTGDLLISYEPQGNSVAVIVQRWVTTTSDPGSGCAATGRLDSVTGLTANVDVQGAVNPSAIANSLPGTYGGTIPAERFGEAAIDLGAVLGEVGGGCFAFTSAWMHSRSSPSESANMQDYVAPVGIDLRRCAASGTKFFDRNANGVREADEPGLPRFVMFADYDDDGGRADGEPFAITDRRGRYVIHDIRPPDGTYSVREALLSGAPGSWTCSYPNAGTPGGFGDGPGQFPCGWGPIAVASEPYARDRDFGNWVPARLTLRKELSPPEDPGRFDLIVNGDVWLRGAGHGATVTRPAAPGVYTVEESSPPAGDYSSVVWCKQGPRSAQRMDGPVFTGLVVTAGQRWVCTFQNVRIEPFGEPAIRHRQVRAGERTGGRPTGLRAVRVEHRRSPVPRGGRRRDGPWL